MDPENSKRAMNKYEDIKKRTLGTKGEALLRYKGIPKELGTRSRMRGKEGKLLEELEKVWDDPYMKETEDRLNSIGAKKLPPRNKSSVAKVPVIPSLHTPTGSSQGFFKMPTSVTRAGDPLKPPLLTTKYWVCLDAVTEEVIFGSRVNEVREVASLTKVMTCMITLDFINQFSIDIDKTHYLVSKKATLLGGTTANLRRDDYVCVRDLMYGLMLPSGNDAAQTLAENIVTHRYILEKHKNCNPNELAYDEEVPPNINLEQEFYVLMNRKARELGLTNTNYDSSHGLVNEYNYSCCLDQAKIGRAALQYPLLQDIVKTSVYSALIERNDRDCELIWRNTNKLLDRKGYKGLKTGITTAAGGCLTTWFQNRGINVITVVLGCRDQNARFTDTEAITNWVCNNYREISQMSLKERIVE